MPNASTGWPAGAAPDGHPYETRAGSVIACYAVTLVLSGVAVGARFYTRGRIQHVLGREDWAILAAWVRHPSLFADACSSRSADPL